MTLEWRPVKHGAMPVYTIGRTYLLELFHTELQSDLVRFADRPQTRRAYEQLANLEAELRDSGMVYTCPTGLHDDLGISCAMLAWAARHPHLATLDEKFACRPAAAQAAAIVRLGGVHIVQDLGAEFQERPPRERISSSAPFMAVGPGPIGIALEREPGDRGFIVRVALRFRRSIAPSPSPPDILPDAADLAPPNMRSAARGSCRCRNRIDVVLSAGRTPG